MKKIVPIIKTILLKSTLSFILLIIYFYVYIKILPYAFLFSKISYKLFYMLLFFVPVFSFLVLTIVTYKNKDEAHIKFISTLMSLGCVLFSFLYALFVAFMFFIHLADNPITNPSKYNYLKVESFPEEVPKSAKEVQIYFVPQVLQGGGATQLYFISEESDLLALEKDLEKRSKWVGEYKEAPNSKYYEIDRIFSFIDNQPLEKRDFTIYIIENTCDNSGYCNHGVFLIGAINKKTNQIIYSYEAW